MEKSTGTLIRVEVLSPKDLKSNRVFVAQILKDVHHSGRPTEHFKYLFVIPTDTDCNSYEIVESSIKPRFYSVSRQSYSSQFEFFRKNAVVSPNRLNRPRNPNDINEFRARILNTKHFVISKEVGGVWCCRDWVIHVLRAELRYNTFPRDKLESLIAKIRAGSVPQSSAQAHVDGSHSKPIAE